ncbi:hypothetical protein [Dactylosporangium sp. CA-092794]|uniref:hypothetical protein n=1 Tax=Dactylosporangium sp. CA-092794 TaxID=3239929 RepID=UPI003D92872C
MAQPLSYQAVLRHLVDHGVIPDTAESDMRRGARWTEPSGLAYSLWLDKDSSGGLALSLNTGDAKLGALLAETSGFAVPIRPDVDPIVGWPTRSSAADLAELVERAREATAFIADRTDLCNVMMQLGYVERGRWHAQTLLGNYPNRLVKAILLAEDLHNEALAQEVRRRIHAGPEFNSNGIEVDILASAKRWASTFGKALGRAIDV